MTLNALRDGLSMARQCAIQLEREHGVSSGAYGSLATDQVLSFLTELLDKLDKGVNRSFSYSDILRMLLK